MSKMINSELLKEAIADAKAVKRTAVLNAKHALEEAFAPRFHAMFADKLREDAGEDEDEIDIGEIPVDEVAAPNQVTGTGGEAKGPSTKDVSKGQPKKVSDANTNYKTVAIGGKGGAAGSNAPAAEDSIMKETSEFDLEEESGVTSEDLDEIIRELEAEVASDAEGEQEPEFPEEPAAPEAEVPGQMPVAPPEGGVPPAPAPEVPPAPAPEGGEEVDPSMDPSMGVPGAVPQAVPGMPGEEEDDVEEEIDLNALLEALTDDEEEEEEEEEDGEGCMKEEFDPESMDDEELDESKGDGVPTNVGGQDASGGVKGYPAAPKDASKNQVSGKNHNVQGKGNIGTGGGSGKPTNEVSLSRENADLKNALNEHAKAIRYLKGQINEVNLLNAKLLYTTKLFKEFNLDNKQKMRVVETFDLLKNVREVKLTFAGMCEALNFGAGKKKSTGKSSGRITESYASKPVASTKPAKEIISESKTMADRFKKLAGIKAKK